MTWIETRSGKRFDYDNPSPDSIDIDDIAYALSNLCRFTGHVRFFSVAEHSVLVAGRVAPELRLAALLHDASEAYLGDIASPLKYLLPDYKRIEARVEACIFDRFNISHRLDDWAKIKHADQDALLTEAHYLIPSKGLEWGDWTKLFKVEEKFQPHCLPPAQAYRLFMAAYKSITKELEDAPGNVPGRLEGSSPEPGGRIILS